jgi:hypothetical protein
MTLPPLPDSFAATTAALHRVAEEIISPARTDGHIWLEATPGGFGIPAGTGREVVRTDGAVLVRGETRTPLDGVDPEAANALAGWYALGDEALRRFAVGRPDATEPKLWPEHFDIAIEAGEEAAGRRANYGFAPGGDEVRDEPYAYVGPWSGGLEVLPYGELEASDDPVAAALAFFTTRAEALT